MAAIAAALRTGSWLTAQRLRAYPLILLTISVLAIGGWLALSDGLVDRNGKPIGTDFSNVYAAGLVTLRGEPSAAYDPTRHQAVEAEIFGRETPYFGWHYPPFFLAIAAALATLSYGWALVVWMAITLPAYLLTARSILKRPQTWLPAAAFPAVFVNLVHGQNGFLTAALLGGAMIQLDRRPIVAGILVGLTAYKPQFALIIPLALLATARWTVIAAAAATVLAASIVTILAWGPEVWRAFVVSTEITRAVLENGAIGWHKMQSLFSTVRMWGGGIEIAYAAQLSLDVAVAGSSIWLWRSEAAFDLKAAALACACLLTTPYVLDYDFVVLGIAIAFLARHGLTRGFHDYEISILAGAWLVPLGARVIAYASGVPIGVLVLGLLYTMTIRRAARDLLPLEHRDPYPAEA